MIYLQTITVEDQSFQAVHVQLPKTDLLAVANNVGYIMCGALDVDLLNDRLGDRNIIAGRAVGVRTIDELLEAPLQKITSSSKEYGWKEGMKGKDALMLIAKDHG